MEIKRMPFELVNPCASCIRLKRRVLKILENVSFYFDNILVHKKKAWEDPTISLFQLINRLKDFELTVKPLKSKFDFKNIN